MKSKKQIPMSNGVKWMGGMALAMIGGLCLYPFLDKKAKDEKKKAEESEKEQETEK